METNENTNENREEKNIVNENEKEAIESEDLKENENSIEDENLPADSGEKKTSGKRKKIIFLSAGIAVVLIIILMTIFLPGRIKETDKGLVFSQLGVAAKEKWVTSKGDTYYFGKDGYAYVGWKDINDGTYFFAKNGVMQKGWIERDGKK